MSRCGTIWEPRITKPHLDLGKVLGAIQLVGFLECAQSFEGKVGTDGIGSICKQSAKVVDLPGFP
jgi:hypothetical protein